MKTKNIVKLLIISLFFISSLSAQSTQNVADSFFKSGMKKFLKGDYPGAISSFEETLVEDPKYKQAKKSLIVVYTTYGKKMFEAKNYETAKNIFTKLSTLDRNNKTASIYLDKIAALNESSVKDFNKEKLKTDISEKSQIEKELETKQQLAETTGKQLSEVDAKTLQQEQVRRQMQILVESKNEGDVDDEALNSFIETLQQIKNSEGTSLDKIITMQREKDKQLKELLEKNEKEKFRQTLIIWILVGVMAIILGWVAWFIIKVFQRRAKVAEATYKFTAQREAKVLEVMNNVVNLDRRNDRSFQIGTDVNQSDASKQIEDATNSPIQSESENITEINEVTDENKENKENN